MKIAICASVFFSKEIIETKKKLEKLGHEVEIPKNLEKFVDGSVRVEDKWEKIEEDVIRRYEQVIKNSDAVLVLNFDKNDISNYIGANSFLEIGFAHIHHKKIFLLNPIESQRPPRAQHGMN